MAWTIETGSVANALARLTQQFKNASNMQDLITAFVQEKAELESVWEDLIDNLSIDAATGTNLDQWGTILNVERKGTSDATYRTRLKAAIFRYVSSGRWEEIIQGFTILTDPRYVQGEEIFPAAVSLTGVGVTDPAAVDADEISEAMEDLKAAGVRITALLVTADPPFVFDGDPDPLGEGFGDAHDASAGGHLADRLL